jgi:hypothetical protein
MIKPPPPPARETDSGVTFTNDDTIQAAVWADILGLKRHQWLAHFISASFNRENPCTRCLRERTLARMLATQKAQRDHAIEQKVRLAVDALTKILAHCSPSPKSRRRSIRHIAVMAIDELKKSEADEQLERERRERTSEHLLDLERLWVASSPIDGSEGFLS